MKLDLEGDYAITDKGLELLQGYREGGLEDIVSDRSKRGYPVIAHTATYAFLTGLDGGLPATKIYFELTRSQNRKVVDIVDDVFNAMVREGMIEKVEEVQELPPLPSAFRKDFGQYE
jgi:hypothetical protein